jgi:hypothetical protein
MAIIQIFVVVLDKLRLEWAGHIIRMEDGCTQKKLLNGKFRNKRQVGKIRIRWEYVVGGTRHRAREYEDGGDERKRERSEGVF